MKIYRAGTYEPEPPTEPPEDYYVTADCGHEVYAGEHLYTWEHGKTLCPDCIRDKINAMGLDELAALLGCKYITVEKGEYENG